MGETTQSPTSSLHHKVLEDIGNTLGKFKNMDLERTKTSTFNYTIIFVEIDLNKGLLDHIQSKQKKIQ